MEEKLDARPHKLELLNREKGSVTGIQDVRSGIQFFFHAKNLPIYLTYSL